VLEQHHKLVLHEKGHIVAPSEKQNIFQRDDFQGRFRRTISVRDRVIDLDKSLFVFAERDKHAAFEFSVRSVFRHTSPSERTVKYAFLDAIVHSPLLFYQRKMFGQRFNGSGFLTALGGDKKPPALSGVGLTNQDTATDSFLSRLAVFLFSPGGKAQPREDQPGTGVATTAARFLGVASGGAIVCDRR
jgi:hypothetical protein